MKVVKHCLSHELDNTKIHPYADWHIGDPLCDMQLIKNRIEYINSSGNDFVVLNGDLCDAAIHTSIGDSYAAKYTPDEQIDLLSNLLEPIKDKILCMTSGNHENRIYKATGIDISKQIARNLDIADLYNKESVLLFTRFGINRAKGMNRYMNYSGFMRHGSGGGGTAGSKANQLKKMSSVIDADFYVHAHTHQAITFSDLYYRASKHNWGFSEVERVYVNSASTLKYGGYGEDKGFSPCSTKNPVIHLSGTEHKIRVEI